MNLLVNKNHHQSIYSFNTNKKKSSSNFSTKTPCKELSTSITSSSLNKKKQQNNLDSTHIDDDTTVFLNQSEEKSCLLNKFAQGCQEAKQSSKAINPHNKSEGKSFMQPMRCLKHPSLFGNEDQQATFQPKLKPSLPYDIYPEKYLNTDGPYFQSKQDRFQRLIEDDRRKQLSRFELKGNLSELNFKRACTFVPSVNYLDSQTTQKENNTADVHQRLFEEAKQLQTKKLQTFNQEQQNENKQFQKMQKINADRLKEKYWQKIFKNNNKSKKFPQQQQQQNNDNNNSKSIHQRLNIIADQKQIMLKQLQAKYYPLSTNKNRTIRLSPQRTQNMVHRLINQYKENRQKSMDKLHKQTQNKFKETFTFTPKVNHNNLLRTTTLQNRHSQCLQCQYQQRYYQIPNSQQYQYLLLQNPEFISSSCSHSSFHHSQHQFQPKINQISKLIMKYLQQRKGYKMTDSMKVQQLHKGNLEKKQENLSNIQKSIYKECCFYPTINQLSRQLMHMRCQQSGDKLVPKHICPQPQSIKIQERQLTFSPKINIKSRTMSSQQKTRAQFKSKTISRFNLQKQQKNKQYEQLKQCTFKPQTLSTQKKWKKWKDQNLKINKLMMANDGKHTSDDNTVKGINCYLSNQSRARKKKQTAQKIYEETFLLQNKYDRRVLKQLNRKRSLKLQKNHD